MTSDTDAPAWVVEDDERVRPWALTGGRTRPSQAVDVSSYVKPAAAASDPARLDPELQQLVALLNAGPVAVMELAGRLELPAQVVRVLVSDLIESGDLVQAMPTSEPGQPTIQLLERVIEGLRNKHVA